MKDGIVIIKLKKYFRFHSIRTSIIAAFSLLILFVVTSACLFAYQFTLNNDTQMSINYSSQLVNKINSNIDEYIDQMKVVSNSLANSEEIKHVCSIDANNESLIKSVGKEASTKMNTITNSRSDIVNIAVLTTDGNAVFSNTKTQLNPYANYRNMSFYTGAIKDPNHNIISSTHVQNLVYNKYNWVISISKALYHNNIISGVLLIDLNYSSISNICKNVKLGNHGYIFIVDSSENIIYHPQQQLIYSNIKKEYISDVINSKSNTLAIGSGSEKRYYVINRSKLTGWTTIGVIYADELIDNKRTTILFYFTITLVSIIFAIACAFFISTRITRPLKLLEQDMNEVEKGNLKIRSVISLDNEIGQLGKAFNVMLLKTDELLHQRLSDQEQKRRSELKALIAQIKPHFLYNTLDTIIWLAEGGNNADVIKVTSALATLFRTSISKEEDLTSLNMEIQNVKSYLTIQQLRYSDMVSFIIDIPSEILHFMVVKLMLQPIVENAIYHGIKPKNAPGKVSITGKVENGDLIIDVSDDGVGMTEEQLLNLFTKEKGSQSSNSIGVNNVNDRIKLYFGDKYGMKFTSISGVGTTVHICIPALEEMEAHNV